MSNPNQRAQDDDDSWEVRAFVEDTSNIEGMTWPPRSYTCTFCRREFRSAQALGGHMNVHRRDRARLHQTPSPTSPSTATSSTLIIPNQTIGGTGGLCFLYTIPNPNPNGIFTPTMMAPFMDPSSNPLSISPHPTNNLISPSPPSINLPVPPCEINSFVCHSSNIIEPSTSISNYNKPENSIRKKDLAIEEVDLELRLGRRASSS